MRRFILCVALLFVPLALYAEGFGGRAEWHFGKKQSALAQQFTESGRYPNKVGIEGATLSFHHRGRLIKAQLDSKGFPTAHSVKGDYWLFDLPVESIAAGTAIDVFLPFTGNEGENNSFTLEYRDGKKWLSAVEITSTTSHKHLRRLWHTVVLKQPIVGKGRIMLRLRQAEKADVEFTVACPSLRGQQPQIVIYNNAPVRDTVKMLFLGNSYTYYHTYPVIFKELAWSEGHYADCKIFISGGYNMAQHLANPHSVELVDMGGYDYVMLQDQSVQPVLNGTADDAASAENLQKMVERVKKHSPTSKVFIEITWGRRFGNNNLGNYEQYADKYPHLFADYDAMQGQLIKNITAEAELCGISLHPLGYAWQIVMHERPDINLYHSDNHHQSYAGSYLSAAVAYLAIYGEPFSSGAANGKLDAKTAEYLRSVAQRVVLQGEKWDAK